MTLTMKQAIEMRHARERCRMIAGKEMPRQESFVREGFVDWQSYDRATAVWCERHSGPLGRLHFYLVTGEA